MSKHILNETQFFQLLTETIIKSLNEIQYGDNSDSRMSNKTGRYGGINQAYGNRGSQDKPRGDKDEYVAGIPKPFTLEIYTPQKMAFFKAKHFGSNANNVNTSNDLFQNVGEMGWEMNNLQSATNGEILWKIITDDPDAKTSGNNLKSPNTLSKFQKRRNVTPKNYFWLVKLPGNEDWQLFKVNMTKRYNSDYNPTSIKRINR